MFTRLSILPSSSQRLDPVFHGWPKLESGRLEPASKKSAPASARLWLEESSGRLELVSRRPELVSRRPELVSGSQPLAYLN